MIKVLCFICFFFCIFGTFASGLDAGVNVDIVVSTPPPFQFDDRPDAQPELLVIPSGPEYVYMVPDMSGVYFYRGFWYRYYEGSWFRAAAYNVKWVAFPIASVPAVIISVPPEYPFYVPQDYYRIRSHDALVRWREWERIRHWNHYDWYKNEMKADVVEKRHREIEKERALGQAVLQRRINERRAAEHREPADVKNLPQPKGPEQPQQHSHGQPYPKKLPEAAPQVSEQHRQQRPGPPYLQKPGQPEQKLDSAKPEKRLKPQPEAEPQHPDHKGEEKKEDVPK